MKRVKFTTKKLVLVAVGMVVVAIVGFVAAYQYNLHSTRTDFQEYAPSTLPPGISIKEKEVGVIHEKDTISFFHDKGLYLDFTDSGTTYIREFKASTDNSSCGDLEVSGVNQICALVETPKQQKYRLTTTYELVGNSFTEFDTNKPSAQQVDFQRGNTNITIYIENHPMQVYSKDIWNRVVDSFEPTHFSHIPVNQLSPGP